MAWTLPCRKAETACRGAEELSPSNVFAHQLRADAVHSV